jgi:hypothetical protein
VRLSVVSDGGGSTVHEPQAQEHGGDADEPEEQPDEPEGENPSESGHGISFHGALTDRQCR